MDRSKAPASILLVVALLAAGNARGHSASPVQEPPLDCSEPQTTVDIVNCLGRDFEAAEAGLVAVVRRQIESLDEPGAELFRAAQDAWSAFREAECLRVRDYVRGGTMAAVLGSACMVELTRTRTAQLANGTAESTLIGPPANIFWQAGDPLVERFSCDGPIEARAGLLAAFDPERGGSTLYARIQIGTEILDFPIANDTQDSFCGADITIETYDAGSCPGVRVDDGLCDAFFIAWNVAERRFTWSRR